MSAVNSGISRRGLLLGVGGLLVAGGGLAACSGSPARRGSGRNNTVPPKPPTVVANVVYWDQQAGFASLNRHPDLFTQVSPMWYAPDGDHGLVPADRDNVVIDTAQVKAIQARGHKVIPTLVNMVDGEWKPKVVTSMLEDEDARATHVRAIVDLVDRQGYDGVDIDYEQLRAKDRDTYTAFLRELADPLHERGKLLVSGVYAKESEPGPEPFNIANDYRAIGEICDQVRVQTFEYAYEDSDPGPIAPLDKVEATLKFAVTQIPPVKIIMGVMLLGYDWPDGDKGVTVSYQQATDLANRYNATVEHRLPGDSPTFTYTDDDDTEHTVWYEDATSTREKLDAARRYGVGGVFFWRLGGEDPATWSLPEIGRLPQ